MRAQLCLAALSLLVACSAENAATGNADIKVDPIEGEQRDDASTPGPAPGRDDGAVAKEDASARDASTPDAAPRERDGAVDDAGAVRDAGQLADANQLPDASDVPDASTPVDAGSEPDAGEVVDASVPDAGEPPIKGCGPGAPCKPDQYCDFAGDPLCGAGGAVGTCKPFKKMCAKNTMPVCGCDKRSYGNECEAAAAGVSVMRAGLCSPAECQAVGGQVLDTAVVLQPVCTTTGSFEVLGEVGGALKPVLCCLPTPDPNTL